MKKLTTIIIFIFSLFCITISNATIVPKLNWGHVLVTNRSNKTLQNAIPQAMQQVLIKNSGQVDVAAMPNIQQFLTGANKLMLRYYYSAHPKTPATPWQLNVEFDRKSIEKYLLDSGLSLWSADRPITLAFIYINDGKTTQVLNNDDAPLQAQYMQQIANQRGVPLMWPMYDVQDQQNININKTPTNEYMVADLSHDLQNYWFNRYKVGAILYGVVWNTGISWYGNWYVVYNNHGTGFNTSGVDINQVLGNAVAQLSNYLSGQMVVYAENSNQPNEVQIWVSSIHGLQGFHKVSKFLQNLAPVSQVSVGEINANGALFNVQTKVGAQGLMKLLQQSGKVRRMLLPVPYNVPDADIYYQWQQP